ncbi:MAG: peptide chain release factor N(5)-glutamine methyltransferase [Pseudomonadota bacterium]
MTVAEALRVATERLSTSSDTARLDAELLMAHALGTSRSEMLLRHMADRAPAGFHVLIERRANREPVAYIIGIQEFYGREFAVNRDVLIPRDDSETVIEAALSANPGAARVLDLGTGSGALLLTILAETDAHGVGIDQSEGALAVARANAERLGLSDRVELRVADWNDAGWSNELGQFDLIVANPPYVENGADLDPDVRNFEPGSALFAGPEGLDDYRVLIPQLRRLMLSGGTAVIEIGATQDEAVAQIAENAEFTVKMHRDLAGRPRALVLH